MNNSQNTKRKSPMERIKDWLDFNISSGESPNAILMKKPFYDELMTECYNNGLNNVKMGEIVSIYGLKIIVITDYLNANLTTDFRLLPCRLR